MKMFCQVEVMDDRVGMTEDEAIIDVTVTSSLVIQDVIRLCERFGLNFHLRDGAMQVLLPLEKESREALYASLDRRRIEYTLPLFGG